MLFPKHKPLPFTNPYKGNEPNSPALRGNYSVVVINDTTDTIYRYARHCSNEEAHEQAAEAIDDFAGDLIHIYIVDETAPLDPFIIGYLD